MSNLVTFWSTEAMSWTAFYISACGPDSRFVSQKLVKNLKNTEILRRIKTQSRH